MNQNFNHNQNNETDGLIVRKHITFTNNLNNVKYPQPIMLLDQWILLLEDQNFKIIYKSINQQSILLIYKQLLVQDLDTQSFLMNLIMSIIDSCSFFFFQGEMDKAKKLNKLVGKDTQVLKLYELFKKLDQDNQDNIILEYQISCFSHEIQFKKMIDKAINEIQFIDNLLKKYYNKIKSIKSDENNYQFDKIISEFIQDLRTI